MRASIHLKRLSALVPLLWCFQGRGLHGAETTQQSLDLSPYEPNLFYSYEPPTTALMALPRGRFDSDGTTFFISRYCGLIGYPRDPDRPAFVGGIQVGAFVEQVHLLHCCAGNLPDGQPVYGLRFHYDDGSTEIAWLLYGSDLDEWWGRRVPPLANRARPAWFGTCRETTAFRVFLQMFHTSVENPHPAKRVASFDLLSAVGNCTPLIGAVTLDVYKGKPPSGSPAADTAFSPPGAVREVVIRLLDAETKTPIPNADVQVLASFAGREVRLRGFRTATDGTGWLFVPRTAAAPLALDFSSGTHLPTRVSFSAADLDRYEGVNKPLDYELKKGVAIGGLVTDSLGAPVPGASLAISQIRHVLSGQYEESPLGTAIANTDGRWQAACLMEGFQQVFLGVSAPGFVPALYEQESPEAGSPLQVSAKTLIDQKASLKMERSMDLHGRVTAEGKAVENAQISLIYGVPTDIASQRTATDSNGEFRIKGLESGQGYIVVESYKAAPTVRPVQWYLKNAEVNFELAPGQTRAGIVTDQSGSPVPDAMVLPCQWSEGPALSQVIRTDQDGKFSWPHSPDGEVWVQVGLLGESTTTPPILLNAPGAPSSLTINLRRRAMVRRLRILDARDDKPVPVLYSITGRSYGNGMVFWDEGTRRSGSAGTLLLQSPDLNSPAEQQVIGIEAPGYAPLIVDSAGLDRGSVFKLQADPSLAISVTRPNGDAAAQGAVLLVRKGQYVRFDLAGRLQSMQGSPGVPTDEKGKLSTFRVADLQWLVAYSPNGTGIRRYSEDQTNFDIQLQPGGNIEGEVRIGPSVQSSDQLRLQTFYSLAPGVGRLPYMLSEGATIGANGRFVFSNIPPSRASLALSFTGFRHPTYGYSMVCASHAQAVVIRPGETTRVVLGGSGRTVVGKLTHGSSADNDWVRRIRTASLAPNREMPQALKQPTPQSASNNPQAATELMRAFSERRQAWLDSAEGTDWTLGAVDYALRIAPDGAFRVDSVPPGEYTLRVGWANTDTPGPEQIVSRPVTIASGSDSATIELGEIPFGN